MSFGPSKGRGSRYGADHQRTRKAWAAQTTPATPCVRCGHALGPAQRIGRTGRTVGLWHLDHAEDGSYLGMSHGEACKTCGRKCNVSAGASKGARVTNAKRKTARSTVPFVRPTR